MINELFFEYIKSLSPEEFKNQVLNKTLASNFMSKDVKNKLVKVEF